MVSSSTTPFSNWIHLDFKGMIPSVPRLMRWLDWLRSLGFSGIVLEYEDRYPWETFPGTYREGYDAGTWRKIGDHCRELGFEVVPLIQTFGHLEWLLKHDEWKFLRCDDHINLVCPEHPEIRSLLKAWIHEVARLHPESKYIHVGLDEVYHMGACERCRQRAAQSPLGNQEVFLRHARYVCETALEAGMRPILWADMLLEGGEKVLSGLPEEAIPCHWAYYSHQVGDQVETLAKGNREVMGASAVRCVFPEYHLMGPLSPRLDNMARWHQKMGEMKSGTVKALMHTTWGRSRHLSSLYGPWEGYLPAFLRAAHPQQEWSTSLQKGMELLEGGRGCTNRGELESFPARMHDISSTDPMEENALRWWELTLQHQADLYVTYYHCFRWEVLRSSFAALGKDPELISLEGIGRRDLAHRLESLEHALRVFLTQNEWSDTEEFIDSRTGALKRLLHFQNIA